MTPVGLDQVNTSEFLAFWDGLCHEDALTRMHTVVLLSFCAVFSGSDLASPRAVSANATSLKEALLFTWIIIRILCASSQRNGPSGSDPSSLTQSLLFGACPSDVPQTLTMWQNNAFYRRRGSSSCYCTLQSVKRPQISCTEGDWCLQAGKDHTHSIPKFNIMFCLLLWAAAVCWQCLN